MRGFTTDAQSFFIVVPILARPGYHGVGWLLWAATTASTGYFASVAPDFVISNLDLYISGVLPLLASLWVGVR